MHDRIAPHQVATGVLAVLSGTSLHRAAFRVGMQSGDLADAVEVFKSAGAAALRAQDANRDWYQVRIRFFDWSIAEHIAAAHLGPHLHEVQNTGVITGWWFVRKAPCWRLRCRPGPTATLADVRADLSTVLHRLTAAEAIGGWWENIYEPETLAFGGPPGMHIAHELFHADSAAILDYLRRQDQAAPSTCTIGRRELSILLCTGLFRAAGQEWHEHGDIWHRVTAMRPLPPDAPVHRIGELTANLFALITADTTPSGPLFGTGGPLAPAAAWATAFIHAGEALGKAARHGTLQRGLRDTLAHHVIFHWNRLGLPARTQAVLAQAARDTVMNPPTEQPLAQRSTDVART
jgi:thiopeptide-type bacteriocin biosynthesis protein